MSLAGFPAPNAMTAAPTKSIVASGFSSFSKQPLSLPLSLPQPRKSSRLAALPDHSQTVTWQVVVGTVAGITPFVVAGVEFSKRIATQKKCKVCGGSGLVKRDEYFFRCYSCGGFLPWQSWKQFFSGK